MTDLLIELGCEELPAGSVNTLAEHLGSGLSAALSESGLCSAQPQIFATPRRLAVRFSEVNARQDDEQVERRGPAKAAAFDNGEPTKALQGFLRSAGAGLEDIETVQTPKGEWVVVRQLKPGKKLADVLMQKMPDIFKSMPMPRRMRWGDGGEEFLRPVVWLLAIHGNQTLPVSVLGLQAENVTYGHRFHAPDRIQLDDPADYEARLKAAYVLADPNLRRAAIVDMVNQQAAKIGGSPILEDDLVDEVNALVEWPVALSGEFDSEYLEIPKEALIQTMQENQRYFGLLDDKQQLLPAFITIANIESTNPQVVIDGNERVIRPRFADTMFFWDKDKERTLTSHRDELSRLLFQEKLGSVADKVQRMGQLSHWLCAELNVDADAAQRAVDLCKCDLNTEIVKELAKMQGLCGYYYALRDGESADVAEAMEQHYFPKQAGGQLPGSGVSQVVALADKTDTLVGIFGLGMTPTGTRDPFGLRRASIALCRIIIECERDLDLQTLIQKSADTYADRLPAIDQPTILSYVIERLRGYLTEQGYAVDAVDAVLAKSIARPSDIVARVEAMVVFRQTDAAVALSSASKRIGNILKKAGATSARLDESLLAEPAEIKLHEQLAMHRDTINDFLADRDYAKAMRQTAELRDPVDRFFDEVMVMDENLQTRDNRLALLQQVNTLCCATAELGLLRSDGGAVVENSAS